jgi:hypothetical protein
MKLRISPLFLTFIFSVFVFPFTAKAESQKQPVKKSRIYTAHTHYFTFTSEDANTVQYLSGLSKEVVECLKRFFTIPKNFKYPVFVSVIPENRWKSALNFKVKKRITGKISLFIRWNRQTQLDWLIQALTRSFMENWLIWKYDNKNEPDKLPLWIELALVENVKIRLNPVYKDRLQKKAQSSNMLKLEEILNAESFFENKEQLAVNSYFFLHFLLSEADTLKEMRQILTEFLKGKDTTGIITQWKPHSFKNSQEIELWWAVAYYHMINQSTCPIYSLQMSKKSIEELMQFTILDLSGRIHQLSLIELWEVRDDQIIGELLRGHILFVKENLHQINPVYYNTFLSLGQLFEILLHTDTDDRDRFEKFYALFKNDIVTANNLTNTINTLLEPNSNTQN